MLRNQREKDLPTKQEGGDQHNKPPAPITSSRLWSGLKNPRIVRVSRAFGGKDRHSKVSTIRGLRDRRVRLSVPTAIQLYDLQDKLGLNQPSKVVDWLLNAAQNEIDKLPPLQFPPEYFEQFSNRSALPVSLSAEEPPLQMISSSSNKASNGSERLTSAFPQYSAHWNSDALQRFKRREAMEKDNNNVNEGDNNAQISPSEEPLYRSSMPYATSYYQWEASNTYLSQLGIIRPSPTQSDAPPPLMSFLSSGSLIPQESQIMFCPPRVMPSMFSSYVATPNTGSDYDARLQNPHPNSQRD